MMQIKPILAEALTQEMLENIPVWGVACFRLPSHDDCRKGRSMAIQASVRKGKDSGFIYRTVIHQTAPIIHIIKDPLYV